MDNQFNTRTGETGQLQLQVAFTMSSKVTRTPTRCTSITRAIGVFIAKTCAHFPSWKALALFNLFTNLNKVWHTMQDQLLRKRLSQKLYEDIKSTVYKCLNQASYLALTTGSWTSTVTTLLCGEPPPPPSAPRSFF